MRKVEDVMYRVSSGGCDGKRGGSNGVLAMSLLSADSPSSSSSSVSADLVIGIRWQSPRDKSANEVTFTFICS